MRPKGLRKLRSDPPHYVDDLAPGWSYIQRRRDWSLRGYTRGAAHQWAPLTWWEARYHSKPKHEFERLQDAVGFARTGLDIYLTTSAR